MRYFLSLKELNKLHRRAYKAQQGDHNEVCGVLIANSDNILELCFLKNHSDCPGHWEIKVKDVISMRRAARSNNKPVVGTFHSHPVSEAAPSPGDINGAKANRLELIYDVCGLEAKLWRILKRNNNKAAIEVELILTGERSKGSNV